MYDRKVQLDSETNLVSGLALVLGAETVTGIKIQKSDAAVLMVTDFLNSRHGRVVGEVCPTRFVENVAELSVTEFIQSHYGALDMSNVSGKLHSYEVKLLDDDVVGIYISIEPSDALTKLLAKGRECMFTTRTMVTYDGERKVATLDSVHGFDAILHDNPAAFCPTEGLGHSQFKSFK